MMDLFFDRNYINDCENKLDYYKLIINQQPNISLTGYEYDTSAKIFKSGLQVGGTYENVVVILSSANIDDLHMVKKSTGEYCQEQKISETSKKFILGTV